MSRSDNQTTRVLSYLKTHTGLTSMEAFKMFGCTRLSAKIYELRKAGYDIVTIDCEGFTRYGDKRTYAQYRLLKDNRNDKK